MLFKNKNNSTVAAVQWKGHNYLELVEVVSTKQRTTISAPLNGWVGVRDNERDEWQRAMPTDWIVVNPQGEVAVIQDECFSQAFTPWEPPPWPTVPSVWVDARLQLPDGDGRFVVWINSEWREARFDWALSQFVFRPKYKERFAHWMVSHWLQLEGPAEEE